MRIIKLATLSITLLFLFQHCKKVEPLTTTITSSQAGNVSVDLPDGTYAIGQSNSQRTIALASESIEDSVLVLQWKYSQSQSQLWHVTNIVGGYCRISSAYSGKALEAPHAGSNNEGRQLWQWRYDGNDAQLWQIQSTGSGLYKIINKATGLYVNLEAGSKTNGAKITERAATNTADQNWQFTVVTSIYADVDAVNFFRRTSGWIASDGAATALLSDGRVLWLMGDSNIDDYDSVKQKMTCLFQVRNSALLQPSDHSWDWHQTSTLTGNPFGGTQSYFKNKTGDDSWMWPGCGFQLPANDTVYVYNQPLKKKGQLWQNDSNAVWAKIRSSDMKVVAYSMLPAFNDINFGLGFVKESDGYVYAYGNRQTFIYSNLFVARFPANDPNAPWSYFTKNGWSVDVTKAKPIGEGASNSMQVVKVNNKYVCFSSEFSVGCDQGTKIYVSVSTSINGPFSARKEIYTIPDKLQGHYPFFYAVNAHPEFNNNNELLLTYDINGFGDCITTCKNGWTNPDVYRPRAIRIPFSIIDAGL